MLRIVNKARTGTYFIGDIQTTKVPPGATRDISFSGSIMEILMNAVTYYKDFDVKSLVVFDKGNAGAAFQAHISAGRNSG